MQVSQVIQSATQQLTNLTDSPRLDAEVLLAFCLNKTRTWLATWPDKNLSDLEIASFEAMLERRKSGEPIAHITGRREFWSLELMISKDTLIPRPETELLVEKILQLYPQNKNISLLDMGTGSGAIALALASERSNWEIIATDKSSAALDIAKTNAQQLKLTNIDFRLGSWLEPVEGLAFDVIASNPPYIPAEDPHLSQGDVRFEPLSALASGTDGLDDIRIICQQAQKHLKPNGILIIEHGFDQKENIQSIFSDTAYQDITQVNDLANNARLTFGNNPQ